MPLSRPVAVEAHTTLAVTVWEPPGAAPGRPLLALHPGIGDRRIWRWCAPTWAAAGHRVVAFDRRGFGDTAYRPGPHDDLADLAAVMSATGTGPAVVVGNSRGGGLALDLALDHPELVRALVLIAPSVSGYPSERWEESPAETELDRLIEAAEAAAGAGGDRDEVNRLEVRYWLDGTDQPEGRVTGEARALLVEMNARVLAATPPGPATEREPAWPRLDQVTVPTLVVLGQHDLPGFARLGAELVADLPDGRLVTVPDAAHCPQLDQPDRLNELVLGFLAGLGD